MARNQLAKKTVDSENSTVTFKFANGQSLVAKASEIKGDVLTRVILNGIAQKVGDSYAGADSAGEAYHSAHSTWSRLVSGEWNEKGEGAPQTSMLAEAYVVIAAKAKKLNKSTGKPFTVDEVRPLLAEYTEAQRKSLRERPDIAAEMARIAAERAKARETEAKKNASSAKDLAALPDLG